MSVVALALAAAVGLAPGPVIDVRNVVPERYPDVSAVVRVVDGSGRGVPDLRRDDFRVSEDGVSISSFDVRPSFREGGSLAVVLIVDTSGSMRGAPLNAAKMAAKAFVERLGPDDRVAVMAFSDTPRLLVPLSPANAITGLDELMARGETALYDAVDLSIGALSSSAAPARAMVVLTDGGDTVSRLPLDRVTQALSLAAIPVHAVALSSDEFNPDALRQLVDVSNGSYREVATPDDLAGVYRQIAAELLAEYRITYRSNAGPGAHRLTVAVETPSVQAAVEKPFAVAGQTQTPVATLASAPTEETNWGLIVAIGVSALAAGATIIALVLRSRGRRRLITGEAAEPVDGGPTLEGPGVRIPVTPGLLFGRDPEAGVIIDDPTVSRLHARLEIGSDGIWVVDLDSSNGTLVNGVSVSRSPLHAGDLLEIGGLRLRLSEGQK